jgi:membrane protease YdiL (CAAX protease family)
MIEFISLVAISSIALAYATPKQVSALRQAGVPFPMPASFAVIQGIILSAIAAGLGTALRRFTEFSLLPQTGFIRPVLVVTLIGLLGHLLLYYLVFRPRIPPQDALLAERIRLGMGLSARLLQGGIPEEVQFRWGLMSPVVTILNLIFPPGSYFPVLIALLVSALLFALFHLTGARQIGLANSNSEVGLIITDNVWAGIIFGYLLWEYGLVAAMISHALIHAAWFPIEKKVYQRDLANDTDA